MLQWIARKTSYLQKIAVISGLLFAAFFCLLSVIVPPAALAQSGVSIANPSSTLNQGVNIIQQPLGLAATDIRIIIANIIRVALGFLGIIMVVLLLYAGFLWMTAGGNEEQLTKAKGLLKNAIIGLLIVVSSYSITVFIAHLVEGVSYVQAVY